MIVNIGLQMLIVKANVNISSLHIQNLFIMEKKQSAVNAHKLTLGTERLMEMGSSLSMRPSFIIFIYCVECF